MALLPSGIPMEREGSESEPELAEDSFLDALGTPAADPLAEDSFLGALDAESCPSETGLLYL